MEHLLPIERMVLCPVNNSFKTLSECRACECEGAIVHKTEGIYLQCLCDHLLKARKKP
jgi:hypothetical protein